MTKKTIVLYGDRLTLEDVVSIARYHTAVQLTDSEDIRNRMNISIDVINDIVKKNLALYGVTSSFGGLADTNISGQYSGELQSNLVVSLNMGAGPNLPLETIRAAMVLRANTHLIGASAIRQVWDERFILFLTKNVTPLVPEYGSIGASGDLVPLSYIASALAGNDKKVLVDFDGETISAPDALAKLNVEPLHFAAKEGLAMINGTSLMAASAALVAYDFYTLMATALHVHALAIQALSASNQSFHPFLHNIKPHPGQIDVARIVLDLLDGSKMITDNYDAILTTHNTTHLIQDRYSLRCLPQFLGPILETIHDVTRIIEIEMNSGNDNPLVDVTTRKVYCGGNFLGEHISISMDRLRHSIGLMAKHLDVQIAQIMTPEFSNGLPACLIGNRDRSINIGLKGLQICGNSIMPYLLFLGQPIADKFATHAEQYNQNINSMGLTSAQLTRQSINIMKQYLAICLIAVTQAVDLRAKINHDTYDPRLFLSKSTIQTYEAVRTIVQVEIDSSRPYLWNDGDRSVDKHIAELARSITDENGPLFTSALKPTIEQLHKQKNSSPSSSSKTCHHCNGSLMNGD